MFVIIPSRRVYFDSGQRPQFFLRLPLCCCYRRRQQQQQTQASGEEVPSEEAHRDRRSQYQKLIQKNHQLASVVRALHSKHSIANQTANSEFACRPTNNGPVEF